MKKITAILLMAAIALTVSGCSAKEGESSSSQASSTTPPVLSVAPTNTANTVIPSEYIGPGEVPADLPGSVSGTYNGQKVTVRYCGYSPAPEPIDNLYASHFIDGYSIVFVSLNNNDYSNGYGINYIDKSGKMLNNTLYSLEQEQHCFKDGKLPVKKADGTWVYLNEQGEEIGKLSEEEAGLYVESSDFTQWKNTAEEEYNKHFYFSAFESNYLTDADYAAFREKFGYDYIGLPYDGLYPALRDGLLGIIDEDGNEIISPTFPCDIPWACQSVILYDGLIITHPSFGNETKNYGVAILELVKE